MQSLCLHLLNPGYCTNLMYCKKLRTSRETVEHRNFTLSQSLLLSGGWLMDHTAQCPPLEQELDLKRKPSKLSKQYLQQSPHPALYLKMPSKLSPFTVNYLWSVY